MIGNVAKVPVGNSMARTLVIYTVLALGILYLSYDNYQKGQMVLTVLFGLIGTFLLYSVIRSIGHSATPVIDRQSIREIKFTKGIPGLTRSRFTVFFRDRNGRTKKRLILLPGSLSGGQNETEIAVKIMTEEKLIKIL